MTKRRLSNSKRFQKIQLIEVMDGPYGKELLVRKNILSVKQLTPQVTFHFKPTRDRLGKVPAAAVDATLDLVL